jgi:hypothetical protein
MSLELIISGGQTGADQAGWRAARAFGLRTGGWMPRGFRTEDGLHLEYADLYGAKEHESAEYPPRTESNIRMVDAVLIFDTTKPPDLSSGTMLVKKTVDRMPRLDRPALSIIRGTWNGEKWILRSGEWAPGLTAAWLESLGQIGRPVKYLTIAGNRESRAKGIGAWVESYLGEVFTLLGFKRIDGEDA